MAIKYTEPASYFPKSIRDKAFGKTTAKKPTTAKKATAAKAKTGKAKK